MQEARIEALEQMADELKGMLPPAQEEDTGPVGDVPGAAAEAEEAEAEPAAEGAGAEAKVRGVVSSRVWIRLLHGSRG